MDEAGREGVGTASGIKPANDNPTDLKKATSNRRGGRNARLSHRKKEEAQASQSAAKRAVIVESLRKLLKDPDPIVRASARKQLMEIDYESVHKNHCNRGCQKQT